MNLKSLRAAGILLPSATTEEPQLAAPGEESSDEEVESEPTSASTTRHDLGEEAKKFIEIAEVLLEITG